MTGKDLVSTVGMDSDGWLLGKMGVLEGLNSRIDPQGRQPIGINLRDDCTTETSMAFAMRSHVHSHRKNRVKTQGTNDHHRQHSSVSLPTMSTPSSPDRDRRISTNLLNFAWQHGGYVRPFMPGVPGLDPLGDTHGLLAWSR